jgi:dihydrofolate reductase
MHASVYIATSLDGFIARKDGSIDWLTSIEDPAGEDYGYAEFMEGIDAIVMGRGTFETILSFPSWPYTRPVFVLSSTLREIPSSCGEKAVLLNKKPREAVEHISKGGLGVRLSTDDRRSSTNSV